MALDMKAIGKRISQDRCNRRIPMEYFAERTGMDISYLRKIEQGEVIPTLDEMLIIGKALDASVDYLCNGKRVLNDMGRLLEEVSFDKQQTAMMALEYILYKDFLHKDLKWQ